MSNLDDASNIVGVLVYYSKKEIEQPNYQRLLERLIDDAKQFKNLFFDVRLAEIYIKLDDLLQSKFWISTAYTNLKNSSLTEYGVNPIYYLNAVKLSWVLYAVTRKDLTLVKTDLKDIHKSFAECEATGAEFVEEYQTAMNMVRYYLLELENHSSANKLTTQQQSQQLIQEIAEDDGAVLSLEIIKQDIQNKEDEIISTAESNINVSSSSGFSSLGTIHQPGKEEASYTSSG